MNQQKAIDKSRVPQAYIYARVSDHRQAKKDESIPAQIDRCTEYYEYRIKPLGVELGGAEFDKMGMSAFKKPFDKRPAGKRLLQLLKPGDHVIFDKPDRACRKLRDFVNILHWFDKQSISVHFISLNIDTSTPSGRCVIGIMGAVAQFESDLKRERTIERQHYARKHGRPISGHAAIGTKIIRAQKQKGGGKIVVWDHEMRSVMAKIVEMADSGKSFSTIADILEKRAAELNGRTFSKSAFYQRLWTKERVRKCYRNEIFFRENDIHDVTDIPVCLREAVNEHFRTKKRERRVG